MPHASLHDDMRGHDEALIQEWNELDSRIASLDPESLSERRRLLLGLRREEAAVAVARLQVAPRSERAEARLAAETAISVLGHALWYAEHGGSEPRFEQTAAPGGRPLPLVAKSLRRRRSL